MLFWFLFDAPFEVNLIEVSSSLPLFIGQAGYSCYQIDEPTLSVVTLSLLVIFATNYEDPTNNLEEIVENKGLTS
jgi:hypothetical protein